MIKIYQLKPTADNHQIRFASYEELVGIGMEPNPCRYDCVYTMPTIFTKGDLLQEIFMRFNINRPQDFHGHSLSVSDIVTVDGIAWYCDSFGFIQIGAWEYDEEIFDHN